MGTADTLVADVVINSSESDIINWVFTLFPFPMMLVEVSSEWLS
jgi:hypothetical protein